ncbi:MAG: phage tail sheath subtilisin-like domain-containing protein [Oscillospiraceae bacterium]|nr:phage tail sheath subtilisin-like domain-containing protein [Oscillospiraceae bacterium]
MALGAGTFTVQNKILPGAYMNFVSAARADASLSERGVTALPLKLPSGPEGAVFSVRADEFIAKAPELFGCSAAAAELLPLREALTHAREVLAYRVGLSGEPTDEEYADFLQKLESRSFHTLGLPADVALPLKKMFADFTQRMRETAGVKVQCVLYRYAEADYEGVISVDNAPELVYWTAGASAGIAPGRSLMNTVYDGELEVDCDYTAAQLETLLKSGAFVFHRVGDTVRVLEDINTLTSLSAEKNRDFQDNATVRLIDQIATDIAGLFNERYLGKSANNAAGRVALWSDIVAHHRQLEQIGAIEDFSPEDIAVEQGGTKKSVVVRDRVTPAGAMAQLYMTVVIA